MLYFAFRARDLLMSVVVISLDSQTVFPPKITFLSGFIELVTNENFKLKH